jgi:hypothetical protein
MDLSAEGDEGDDDQLHDLPKEDLIMIEMCRNYRAAAVSAKGGSGAGAGAGSGSKVPLSKGVPSEHDLKDLSGRDKHEYHRTMLAKYLCDEEGKTPSTPCSRPRPRPRRCRSGDD